MDVIDLLDFHLEASWGVNVNGVGVRYIVY